MEKNLFNSNTIKDIFIKLNDDYLLEKYVKRGEICGHVIINRETGKFELDYRKNYQDEGLSFSDEINRHSCTVNTKSCMQYHTHPYSDKHYPSGEDIAKILLSDTVRLEILLTISGIWEIYKPTEVYKYNDEKVKKYVIDTLTHIGNILYFRLGYNNPNIDKKNRLIKSKDFKYIYEYINVITSLFNVNIYFTPFIDIIERDFVYEIKSPIDIDFFKKCQIDKKELLKYEKLKIFEGNTDQGEEKMYKNMEMHYSESEIDDQYEEKRKIEHEEKESKIKKMKLY